MRYTMSMNSTKTVIVLLIGTLFLFSTRSAIATDDLSKPPEGCSWAKVDCVQAPCDQPPYVLVCASPTPKPVPTPKPTPTPTHRSTCDDLQITGGNNSTVPAKITLLAKASDNKGDIQKYQFYFGDGQKVETPDREVTHEYIASGTFMPTVYAQDSTGTWITSNRCEARVTVKPNAVESHKADCSDIFLTVDNNGIAPATVTAKVTGYDNKGELKKYKVEFGENTVKDDQSATFHHTYTTAGTYTVRAYVLDSTEHWRGGEEACKKTFTISGKPLTKQPNTGTPTWFTLSGLAATIGGVGSWILKKRYLL